MNTNTTTSQQKPMRDKRFRYVKWTLYSWCFISFLSTTVIMGVLISLYDNYATYYHGIADTLREIIISIGVLCILNQCVGTFGGHHEHFKVCVIYGAVSVVLTGLSLAGTFMDAGVHVWLTVQFAICAGVAFQFCREIRRCDNNASIVSQQSVYMNNGLQPHVVYQMPGAAPQSAYVIPTPTMQQMPGVIYIQPTLIPSNQSGQVAVVNQSYATPHMVTYPTPGPSYVGPISSPPAYSQSQEDNRDARGGEIGGEHLPDSSVNQNIDERKTIPQ